MSQKISLKDAERKVYRSTFADGLWDVFLGCFALQFAIAPQLSTSLGDFWSSAIFLPFWMVAYLIIREVRKRVIAPRIGIVEFGPARKSRLKKFNLVLLVVNGIAFILGIIVALTYQNLPVGGPMVILGILLLAGFSAAGYFLDYPRLYIYGLLSALAPQVGEWLYRNMGATHHGFPIVFGFITGVMILTGLLTCAHFLRNNPIPTPEM